LAGLCQGSARRADSSPSAWAAGTVPEYRKPVSAADADMIDADEVGHHLQSFDGLVQVLKEAPDADRSVGFGIAGSCGY
jgi:hypothetical protein